MKDLSRFLKYLNPYKLALWVGIVSVIMTALLTLPLPWIIKIIIDDILVRHNLKMLHWISLVIIGIFLLRGFFAFLRNYLIVWVGQRVVFDLRTGLYHHLQALSLKFYDTKQTGKIIARITGDIDNLYNIIISGLIDLISNVITFLIVLIVIFFIDWRLAFLSCTVLPFFAINFELFRRKIAESSIYLRRQWDNVMGDLQETIVGAKVIKSFAMESREDKHFKGQVHTNFEWNMRITSLSTSLWTIAEVISSVGTAIVFWYGGYEVIRGHLTTGTLVAFYTFLGYLYGPVVYVTRFNEIVQRALVSAKRIFNIFDTKPEVKEIKHPKVLKDIKGDIEFHNFSFEYVPGRVALYDIDLKVNAGELVALVGPSGAGKTTLINLLARFYDPTKGYISIDGVDIRKAKLESLHKQTGIVLQETFLFSSSIKENIKYGKPDAEDSEMIDAAKAANAHDFIMEFPRGYKTPVGERGVNLSVGQKQRIAIARAILKNPPILILDEATSSLDSETERLIQEALDSLMKNRTTFVIAHRLSTVQLADKIVVMDKGRIVEVGKHEELILKPGLYSKLYHTQFRLAAA